MENSSQLKVSGLIAKADFIMILILGDPHSLHTDRAWSYEMNEQHCLHGRHQRSKHGARVRGLDLNLRTPKYLGSARDGELACQEQSPQRGQVPTCYRKVQLLRHASSKPLESTTLDLTENGFRLSCFSVA